MTVDFVLEVNDVEEDADIELIRERLQEALRLAMPYNYIELFKEN